ncbi:MAG TPA: LysE family translocator [Lysobacter sp.]|nr:LysE family translocator [Lysobacter sp.]
MIDPTTLATYLVIALGFAFLPGPAMLLTLARATSSGTRTGIATGLGIAVGDLIHTAMAVLGISAVILASAFVFSLIKYLGAAYLVYLGVRAILAKADPSLSVPASLTTPTGAFRQAIITEVLNPKSALFFLALLPQFVQPENGLVALQLTTLGALYVLLGLFSTVVVALVAGQVGTFLRRHPAVMRRQGKAVGSLYCLLGVHLALHEK